LWNRLQYVGFEALTVVVMKSSILWDIQLCSSLKVNNISEEHVTSIFTAEEFLKVCWAVYCMDLQVDANTSEEFPTFLFKIKLSSV
jgi:hypothetical protein